MGTFFASRRNQVLVAVAAVTFVVLAALFLGLSRSKKIDVGTVGTATTSPAPSASPSATPDVVVAPSSVPSPGPTVAVAPPVPPSSPTLTAPALSSDGHELQPQDGSETKPSGPPCELAWIDVGWTNVDCGIIFIRSQTPEGSIGYVVEKKTVSSNVASKVLLLTNKSDASDNIWRVRLSASDESLSRFSNIAVKQANIGGDSSPEVVVGFRFQGTGNILIYDIVQLRAAQALFIAASRSLDHGSANINGAELDDYVPYPNANTPSYFVRSVIGYSSGAFRISSITHAPERGPSDFP